MNNNSRHLLQANPDAFDSPRLSHSRRSGDASRALLPMGQSGNWARFDSFGGNNGHRGGGSTEGGAQYFQWGKIEWGATTDGGFQVKGAQFKGFHDPTSGLIGFQSQFGEHHQDPNGGFSTQGSRLRSYHNQTTGHSGETQEFTSRHSGPDGTRTRAERFQSFKDKLGNSSSSTELSQRHHGPGGSSGFKLGISQSQQGGQKLSAMHFSTEGMGRGNLKFSLFQESHGDGGHGGGKRSMGLNLSVGGIRLSLSQGGGRGGQTGTTPRGRSSQAGLGLSLSLGTQHGSGQGGGNKGGLSLSLNRGGQGGKPGLSSAQHAPDGGQSGHQGGGGGTKIALSLGGGGIKLSLAKGGSGMKIPMGGVRNEARGLIRCGA